MLPNHPLSIVMLKTVVAIAALCIAGGQARQFINPVLRGADYPEPGVIFVNGTYYAVTSTNNGEWEKFPIHASSDLQNWTLAGFVFNQTNFPPWSNNDREFWTPEFHQFGESDFRVYFTSRDLITNRLSIGVATSSNILGPYYPTIRPLVEDNDLDATDATVIQNNGQKFLIWKGFKFLYGRELTSDGLNFTNPDIVSLITNDLPWEADFVGAPWIVKQGDTFYMFYTGDGFCWSAGYAVGVARSNTPLGPYEKRGDPILRADLNWKGTGHCSVVQDVNGVDTVMVYHGYRTGEVCNPYPHVLLAQSVGWGPDGWPYMIHD